MYSWKRERILMKMNKKLLVNRVARFASTLFFFILLTACTKIEENDEIKSEIKNEMKEVTEEKKVVTEKNEMVIEAMKAIKGKDDSNPILTHTFGADPFAIEYKDRVYVYMTNDELMFDQEDQVSTNTYSEIRSLRCISSEDLVNWTDHGLIHIGGLKGVTTWANNSWAPAAIWKNVDGVDQFFLYFANSASSIGVLTADSPTGPFRDPLGEPMITHKTPNCENVTWLFDPAVFTDDDGRSYLYFGGGVPEGKEENPDTARVIELGADMISTVGEAAVIQAPYLFEDSGINKIGDTYYYSYCSNFSTRATAVGENVPEMGEIIYMTSSHPMGPWEYQGSILKNPGFFFGTGGNNHHCMIQFKEEWYIFYHAFLLQDAMGIQGGYRSINVNRVTIDETGKILPIQADRRGVSFEEGADRQAYVNPLEEQPFVMMANGVGVSTLEEKKKSFQDPNILTLGEIQEGSWLCVKGVDFQEGEARAIKIKYLSEKEDLYMKLSLDQLENSSIATGTILAEENAEGFSEMVFSLEPFEGGVHDLYFCFSESDLRLYSWQFVAE